MKKIILLFLVLLMSSLGYSQDFSEDFELAPATPDASGVWAGLSSGNWLIRDNRTNAAPNWQTNPGAFAANSGSKAAYVDRENTGPGVYAEEWLITPQKNVAANRQLRFFTRQTFSGDSGTLYRVMVSSDPSQSNLAAFTLLQEFTETQLSTLTPDQLDYEEKIINLTQTGNLYFAFVKVFTQPGLPTAGDRWLIDDVSLVQRCVEPTTLGVNTVTGTSAVLTWVGTAPEYTIEYGESGFTPGDGSTIGGIPDGGATDSYTIPPGTLSPGTAYQFYVTANCAASSSLQTGPFNFTTTPSGSVCADPIIIPEMLPYSDSSDTVIYGNNISGSGPGTSCGTTAAMLGGNDVVYSYTVPATTTGVISIQMDPLGQANTGVFVYSSCANVGVNCIAGVGNNTGGVRDIPVLNVTPGQTIFIVISSTAAVNSFDYVLTLQDVNCAPPTGLSAVGLSQTSATISWQSTATNFEYYVQTSGGGIPATAGTPTTTTSNTVTQTFGGAALAFGTTYEFYVRADCGDGTWSQWAGPYQFTTTNCSGPGCNYTFTLTDSFGDGWNGAVINVLQGATTVGTLGPTFTNGSGPVVINVPVCNGPISVVWQTAGTFPGEVRFTMQNSFGQTLYAITTASGGLAGTTLYSGTVDCNNPACLAPLNLTSNTPTPVGATLNWVNNGTVAPVSWEIFVTTPGSPAPTAGSTPTVSGIPGGSAPPYVLNLGAPTILPDTDYVYYVRAVCSTPGANPWSAVSPIFHTLPTCPKPTALALSNFDLNSIDFTWTPGFTETAWQYIVVPAGSPAPAANDPNWTDTATTTVTVGGLTAGTAYDFYVRAVCTPVTDISTAAGPVSGNTTLCLAADQCAYTFTLTDSFGDGWNGARMQVRQNGVVVATLGTTFTAGGGPIIETVSLCNNVPFELFWSVAGTFPGEVRISVQNNFSQTLYAMTTASAGLAGTVLYTGTVDCFNPACLPPSNLTASAETTVGATLNWVQNGTVAPAAWDIYVVPAGSPAPTPGSTPTVAGIPSGSAPPYVLNLGAPTILPDTDYVYYVRSVCTTPGANDWSVVSPVFHTLPTCPKPTGLAVSNFDINSIGLSWVAGGTETAWEYIVVPAGSPVPSPTDPNWVPSTTTTVTVGGLTEATNYDFYVRAICTPGTDISTISGPVTGNTTICAAADQCAYTFTLTDSFGDGWNGARMQVRQNGIVVATLGTTFTGGAGPIVETVNVCPGIPLDLFWSTAGTFPGEVRISVQNSFNQTIYAMTTASAALAGTVLYSNATPSCTVPVCQAPSNLGANPLITSAFLTWNFIPGVTYEIYLVPQGSPAPTAGSTPTYTNVTTHPFQTTDPPLLASLTNYTFYVRMVCPSGTGTSPWSSGFNFTTLPTCPQPQNIDIQATTADATITFTEPGPATQWEIWVLPTGSPAPAPGTGTIYSGTPVGMTVTVNTAVDLGLTLFPGLYDFYVRSICSPTDASTLAGPVSFYILNVDPICAEVTPTNPDIDADGIINLCPGQSCVDLTATYVDNRDTTTYLVESVPFAPPFPFTGGTQLNIATDDIWSPPVTLPFDFCFFGTNSQSLQVGSNGVITFTPQPFPGNCNWPFTQTIPNTTFPIRNAIYGVYQDINPATSTAPLIHSINYQVLGTAPCRTFVVNYYNVAQFSCGTSVGLQTSQIVLYETSNEIEVYVLDRTVCSGWNSGSGLIGIQNAAGTQAHVPPGRNTGPWEAHNEGWKFKPNGASNVTFAWLQNGDFYSNDPTINVCVDETTTMTAQATYVGCGGTVVTKTSDVLLKVNEIDLDEVTDVAQCDCYTLPALTVGDYYTEPGGQGDLIPAGTQICDSQTVYVYAELVTSTQTCTDEASFEVTIAPVVAPVMTDASGCVNYTLPDLNNPDFNYYTGPGGTGDMYAGTGGDVLTTPGTIYIYGGTTGCTDESQFELTIGNIDAFEQDDYTGCDNFILPELPANQTYHTLPGGGGDEIPALTEISTDQTIYIYAADGDCIDESEFTLTFTDEIIPAFDPIPSICVGATPPALPLASNDVPPITGTWSPVTIDTSAAGVYTFTFTPDGTVPCAVVTTLDVTIVEPIVPTFDPIAPLCLNATPPVLPTVSNDVPAVSGTWSPATIDTSAEGTFTYTFTPDGCGSVVTLDVTINSTIVPMFDPIANICQNDPAPALPNASIEGIPGTWVPDIIDTSTAGTVTYTFTPDLTVSPCAASTMLDVTVDPTVTPVLDPIADVCVGGTVNLPATSVNGLTGTWSPATVDTSVAGTNTYCFTPDAGQGCTVQSCLTINVIAPQAAIFTGLPSTVCLNDAVPTLNGTDDNGIPGSWSPSVIDNTLSGSYTFTPSSGQCASAFTFSVTVLPATAAVFAQVGPVCQGDPFVLPSADGNGITGSWSPAADSQSTTTYTFTPDAGQCATGTTMTVVVNPTVVPVFAPFGAVCLDSPAPAFPAEIGQGLSGSWSPSSIGTGSVGTTAYTFTPDPALYPCAATGQITVEVLAPPSVNLDGACDGSQFVITATGDFGSGPVFSWTDPSGAALASGGPSAVASQTGTYDLTVTGGGCSYTSSFTVLSLCTLQRGISPGDGGKNNFFDLAGQNVRRLEIFNRYGTKVYDRVNYSNEWQGQSDKGDELPDGTYYYMIEYATQASKTGWIYINRVK